MAQESKPSRADQVRARRKIEPVHRKPIPTSPHPSEHSRHGTAPVVARRTKTGAAYVPMASRPGTRRRVYLKTGTPGSEVRLPALPTFRPGWRLLSGVIALAMLLSAYLMKNGAMFQVNVLNLSGAQRVPASEMITAMQAGTQSIIEVVPEDLESRLMTSFPDFKSARVTAQLPNILNVTVEERIPALVWVQDETPRYWVDQQGFTFPIRGEATLPIQVYAVSDPPHPLGYVDPTVAVEPAADAAAAEAQAEVPAPAPLPAVDPDFILAVQAIDTVLPEGTRLLYSAENGLGWNDPRGWQVFFGSDLQSITLKLSAYENIVQAILDRNLQPKLISLEFLHAPYYRLE